MIINIKVPDEAVDQIGVILGGYFSCTVTFDCELCENSLGCECLKTIADACFNKCDTINYLCEVTFNEE